MKAQYDEHADVRGERPQSEGAWRGVVREAFRGRTLISPAGLRGRTRWHPPGVCERKLVI